jgi:hypothetical protein
MIMMIVSVCVCPWWTNCDRACECNQKSSSQLRPHCGVARLMRMSRSLAVTGQTHVSPVPHLLASVVCGAVVHGLHRVFLGFLSHASRVSTLSERRIRPSSASPAGRSVAALMMSPSPIPPLFVFLSATSYQNMYAYTVSSLHCRSIDTRHPPMNRESPGPSSAQERGARAQVCCAPRRSTTAALRLCQQLAHVHVNSCRLPGSGETVRAPHSTDSAP